MSTEKEVSLFLKDFKEMLDFWGVLFLSRDKNILTLSQLELKPIELENILRDLSF